MTRLIGVAACAWCLIVVAGCSKAPPDPSANVDSPVAEPAAKSEPAAQVAVALAPPAAAAAAPAATPGPDCNKVCEPVHKLGCRRASECTESCQQMVAAEVCRTELLQFYACLASEPSNHWECMDDGTGAIKEGFCEREQSSFAACLEKSDVR